MASKHFFTFLIVIITWTCLIETSKIFSKNFKRSSNDILALGAVGYCYQCDARHPGCQVNLDAVILADHKVPCNGQCYVRVKNGCMLFLINLLRFLFL